MGVWGLEGIFQPEFYIDLSKCFTETFVLGKLWKPKQQSLFQACVEML